MADRKFKLDPFVFHGVDLEESSSGNWVGDCPFCIDKKHKGRGHDYFFVNEETGQWDCKSCGLNGNIHTFLEKYAEKIFNETEPFRYKELETARGIPAEAFRAAGMGWDKTNHRWIIPIRGVTGHVNDIRCYNGKKFISTKGVRLEMGGMHALATSSPDKTVWVCEGEWDAIALRWLLSKTKGHPQDTIVWTPGAGVFKDHWVNPFRGRKVILCYDSDEPGDQGALKAESMLTGTVAKTSFLCWPESFKHGYDLNDAVREGREAKQSPIAVFNALWGLLKPHHRRWSDPKEIARQKAISASGPRMPFSEVVNTFKKWTRWSPDLEIGLSVAMATAISGGIPGEPLWVYLIAPPSGGKTMILLSLQKSDRTKLYTCLTPGCLISGYNRHPDPSILPQMNGKTAIFKEGTPLLKLPIEAKDKIYSILRDAYDGRVDQDFGHGVSRHYADLHFNILIGITPAVYGDNQASMGERFLKLTIKENADTEHEKIRKALSNIKQETKMETELTEVCSRFLAQEYTDDWVNSASDVYIDRISALAIFVSLLRATVEREKYGQQDLKYRPVPESGARVGKQLMKLAQMLCLVFGKHDIDDEIYTIIKRVAGDSCYGFYMDIVRTMIRANNPGLTQNEIASSSTVNPNSIRRMLEDMELLGMVFNKKGEKTNDRKWGANPMKWFIKKRLIDVWNQTLMDGESPNAI